MKQFTVTGMTCAACQNRVEKAVRAVPGVESCAVSLLTNSMGVEGTASSETIIRAVENAGYGASVKGGTQAVKSAGMQEKLAAEEDALKDRETPVLRKRLIASLVFMVILMYFSMGAHMWGWPVPAFIKGNHVGMGLLQMLLTIVIMIINSKFFVSGFKSLWHRSPNMDTLIAIGAGAAFGYSTVMLFVMSYAQTVGGSEAAMPYMNEFYFESAGMILTLITVGKMLESYSKGRTTDALKSLMKLAPKTAVVVRGGVEMTIPVDEVEIDDIFVVRPGETIPVDGVVVEGNGAVNESALTGESIPVDKEPGCQVTAATLNQSGFLTCRATRVGEDTTFSQIITMVSDAAATKAPIAKLADTISGVFVPIVLVLAAVVIAVWLLLGREVGYALARGISVLVVSCPCALGLATPVAIMVGNGMGAKHGILFKTAESLQETGRVQIAALDKTGTITNGHPVVTDILPVKGMEEKELLTLAAALEKKSEHPLAEAVMKYAEEKLGAIPETSEFQALPGNGLTAVLAGDGRRLAGGNLRFIAGQTQVGSDTKKQAEDLAKEGKTPLFFAVDGKLMGIIAVADTIKEDSAEAIHQLQNMGIRVVMLTGDNAATAAAIGRQAGVDEVIAGVLPDGKEAVIRSLQMKGRTAMVGDGINDAPALTAADIGIAIGAGADVAIDAADVVLMKSALSDVAAAVRMSRQTYKNIIENLFWALIYNVLLIPLAAGLYSGLGFTMNPMWGAAAMSLSSFFVCMNALRLNLFRMHDASHDRKMRHPAVFEEKKAEAAEETGGSEKTGDTEKKESKAAESESAVETAGDKTMAEAAVNKEDIIMTKTIKIEGMSCGHCEATVKKALEALEGVASAAVSHVEKQAIVELTAEVADDVLKKAVEDKDFTVVSIG